MNNGKISDNLLIIALILLSVMGMIASNTDLLKGIMGVSYLRYGAFVGLLLLAFYNYYFPRLKKIVESGEDVTIDNGKISTFLATLITIVSSVIIADPTAFQAVIGNQYGGVAYSVATIAIAWYNKAYPRNAQYQVEDTENIQEPDVA